MGCPLNSNAGILKKVNKQCLLPPPPLSLSLPPPPPRTLRVSEKTWQVIVQSSRT